jgi:hypothetical protein
MRRWFLILLIALLPWRAWAGDTMTFAMMTPSGIDAHCAEHGLGAVALHGASDTTTVSSDISSHSLCDICNGPAMTAAIHLGVDTGPLPQARQTDGPVRFDSALSRPGHKPPIA